MEQGLAHRIVAIYSTNHPVGWRLFWDLILVYLGRTSAARILTFCLRFWLSTHKDQRCIAISSLNSQAGCRCVASRHFAVEVLEPTETLPPGCNELMSICPWDIPQPSSARVQHWCVGRLWTARWHPLWSCWASQRLRWSGARYGHKMTESVDE